MAAKRRWLLVTTAVIILVVLAGVFLFQPYLEGEAPSLQLGQEPGFIGRQASLALGASDQGLGLRSVRVVLRQSITDKVLLDREFPGGRLERRGQNQFQTVINFEPLKLGLSQGPATLMVEARDRSLRGWLKGNLTRREYQVTVDTLPPRLTLLSRRIYLNRGGSALVIYQASKDATRHGVELGGIFFAGQRPWPEKPDWALCYFAYPQDLERGAAGQVLAADPAGNQVRANLDIKLRWKNFRHDDLKLSDRTVSALAARFADKAPAAIQGDDLKVFLWVNEKYRQENDARIRSLAGKTQAVQLWKEPFLRPQGKPMAGFGDRRTYYYKDEKVSKAYHLGVDLADVAHAPIPAAAGGQVVFAGETGIYGNMVILDHGQSVSTLYGHLSQIQVREGQKVERGQVLGLSGATGLALGDHLHFSVLVGGVFVTPGEWWDPHWIHDNLWVRYEEAGLPRP